MTFLRFLADRRGNTALFAAALAVPLTGAAGLSTDIGLMIAARTEAASALDAAVLALGSSTGGAGDLETRGERFFRANFKEREGFTTIEDVWVDEAGDERIVMSARVRVDPAFGRAVGFQPQSITVHAEARRAMDALLVSLVLDNTGSMWSNNNIAGLRDASQALVDTLFGDDEDDNPNLRVALTPYAAAVNPGLVANDLVAATPHGAANPDGTGQTWRGCVQERAGVESLADTEPGSGRWWTPYYWLPSIDNAWTLGAPSSIDPGPRNSNGLTGPNIGCPTPITPLTNDKDEIDDAIAAMSAWNRGGTLTDIGLAWGYRVLTPGAPFEESDETDPATGQSVWTSQRWRKAIVLMTDGESQFFKLGGNDGPNKPNAAAQSDMTGYGRLGEALANSVVDTSNRSTAMARLNTRIENLCTEIKAQGVTIYAVVFTSGVGQSVRDMYQRCASDPGKFWYSPTQTDLTRAFRQIGRDLTRLRLAA